MAGLEGAVAEVGSAVGTAAKVEGGLGAAAIGTAVKVEGLGTAMPRPELGIGNLGPSVGPEATLAKNLEANLGAPEVGIGKIAGAITPEVNALGVGPAVTEAPPSLAPAQAEAGAQARNGALPDTNATSKPLAEGERPPGEILEGGAPKTEQPPKAEGPDNAADATGEAKNGPKDEKTKSPEDVDKAKRTEELEERVKNRKATTDEIKELRELKEDPEQKRKDLEQKAIDGTITDDEAEELGKLNSAEDTKNLTPEQQMEKVRKDVDELGTELMKKMANGEEVTPQDLEKLRNLRAQESLMNEGFTPDQAKSLREVAEKMKGKWGERQTQAAKEIQAEIQELMSLELYLLSIPKTVEQLRAQAKALKDNAQAKHNEAEGAKGQDRLKKKGEEYTLYMQLLNAKSAIVAQKHMAPRIEARRQDLEQAVRRKLGVSHGFGALVEWGAAKTRNIATGLGVGIEEEADFRSGND